MKTSALSEVTLLNHMGNDMTVISAARVSTGKADTTGIDHVRDRKLLNYLWANHHLTPFEQVMFTFHVKTPIFVARQLFRHRTGHYNEASARYKEMPTEFFVPAEWRLQNTTGNKQGSNGVLDWDTQAQLNAEVHDLLHDIEHLYEKMLTMGVAKELARVVLPVGLYTEFIVTFDLRNLFHLIALRSDSHAQPEIQEVANQMFKLIQPIVPWSADAFEHMKNM